MNSALWLLMKLRLKGWGRRLGRTVRTVKGAILTILFGIVLVGWLGSMAVSAVVAQAAPASIAPAEQVERYVPLVLLIYCLAMVASSGSASPFVFSPAEVQFLFSGPFTRRQLLTYKLVTQFLLTLPFSLFMSFALRSLAGTFVSGFVAALLTFLFMQMFGITVNLVSCAVGEFAYSRARRIGIAGVLLVLLAAAGYALWSGGLTLSSLKEIEHTTAVEILLAPLKWFAKVLTAREWDLRFFRYAAQAGALDVGLLALVFILDARYMEQAALNSEKRYARLARFRSGGLAGLAAGGVAKPKIFLSPLPWLGGAGPIIWRQLLAALRSNRVLGMLLFATLISCIGPIIAMLTGEKEALQVMPFMLAGMVLFMSIVLNQTLAFDFRADIDRMEVLKSLPIPAWRIAVGQLVTPVLYSSLYQIGLIAVLQIAVGRLGEVLAFTVALAVPVNLLLVGVENWLFLLFPARMGPATPGDFSHAGRQMLLMLGKGIALLFGLGLPAVFAATAYFITGQNWFFAVVAAFVPALILSILPIPLVTLAFKNFDVARDTPP